MSDWRIHLSCPACKQVSRVPGNFVGRAGLCPGCLDPLRVPDPGKAPQSAREAVAALPELSAQDVSQFEGARWGVKVGWAELGASAPREVHGELDELDAHCRACGEPIRALARVCDHCGEYQLEGDRAEAYRGGLLAAPLWRRGLALGANLVLLAPVLACLGGAYASYEGALLPQVALAPLALCGGIGALLLLWVQSRSLVTHSASLGKRWLGLRVVSTSGARAGLGEALLREGLFWILLTPLCAGLGLVIHGLSFLLLLTGQSQGLHDLVSSTLVVETPREEGPGSRPAP